MITDGKNINRECIFCPNMLEESFGNVDIFKKYRCKLNNKSIDINIMVPHWCPLEEEKKYENL